MVPEFLTGTFFNVPFLEWYNIKKKPIEDDSIDIKEEHRGSHKSDAAKIPEMNKAQQATGSDNSQYQRHGKDQSKENDRSSLNLSHEYPSFQSSINQKITRFDKNPFINIAKGYVSVYL